jgi:hypothetical protein
LKLVLSVTDLQVHRDRDFCYLPTLWLKLNIPKRRPEQRQHRGASRLVIERPKICNFRPRLALAAPLNSEAAAVPSFGWPAAGFLGSGNEKTPALGPAAIRQTRHPVTSITSAAAGLVQTPYQGGRTSCLWAPSPGSGREISEDFHDR